MSGYLKTDTKTVNFENTSEVTEAYNNGFVFTRLGKGIMNQTRSLRINLENFELNSENRRILRKTEELDWTFETLPLENYSWEIHKLGKDYYDRKFGEGTMSASKIKEMFVEEEKSNMNGVFVYITLPNPLLKGEGAALGYCLSYSNDEVLHYAYPFYDLDSEISNLGMGMMLRAIIWAVENEKKYIYLGSVVDPSSKYKLQFEGLEWFDTEGKSWSTDFIKLKSLL